MTNFVIILLAYLGIGFICTLLLMKLEIRRGVDVFSGSYYLMFFGWPLLLPITVVLELCTNYNLLEMIFYKLVRNSK